MRDDTISQDRIDPGRLRAPALRASRSGPQASSTAQDTALPEPEERASEPQARLSKLAVTKPPLSKFSLRGMADELEARATETKPLLGKFVMQGQATMIYAAPNTGKTLVAIKLCLNAIDAGLIDPNKLYYVNADDSSQGLAEKLRLMDDAGANMLAPGFKGFRSDQLAVILTQMIDEGLASGTCVVLDTMKKFTDLMDKKRSSEFAQVCRQYVMAAGTIVALGHTAKNPNADGSPRYQGTTDILEDFDAVYVGQPMTSKRNPDLRGARFSKMKCRADSPETVAYAYTAKPGVSYPEKLASVLPIDPDDLDDYATESDQVSDPPIMEAIVRRIRAGCMDGKMVLAKAVAKECGVSHRAAIEVLERYTGGVPRAHLWNFQKGPRGIRIYRLIDQRKPGD